MKARSDGCVGGRYSFKTFRVTLQVKSSFGQVFNPTDAGNMAREIMKNLDADREHVIVIFGTVKNEMFGYKHLFSGGSDRSTVAVRDVLRSALLMGADSVIVVHNHPGGELSPSADDRTVTRAITLGCAAVGLRFLDHVIIHAGNEQHFSFQESGLL